MKSIMLSAIAISAAALASCGGDGGDSSTVTFYESSINGSLGGFDLYETVMSTGFVSPCAAPAPAVASSANPYLAGVVVCGGTNETQIAYAVNVPGHSVSLTLNGHFSVPPNSLADGLVTGTTGTVQTITEAIDGQTVFLIEGLNVDASSITDAIAGGDSGTFWRLVADGAPSSSAVSSGGARSLDGVYSGSGTFSVYCGANNTGAAINLTSAATPMVKFLDGC
jgi:hypothetical protein